MSDVEAKKNLRHYLNNHGWVAYPREMLFGRFCDVVGFHKGKFYAFEIKQKGDTISKAIKQLKDYSDGVHYCVLVVDAITQKMTKRFEKRGYGVWERNGETYTELVEPIYREPRAWYVSDTANKFRRECRKRFPQALATPSTQTQRLMEDFNG